MFRVDFRDKLNSFVDDFFTIFKAVIIQQALGLENFPSPSSEILKCKAEIIDSKFVTINAQLLRFGATIIFPEGLKESFFQKYFLHPFYLTALLRASNFELRLRLSVNSILQSQPRNHYLIYVRFMSFGRVVEC